MTEKMAVKQKPRELLLLFIGFLIYFAVSIFVPEEVNTIRSAGFFIASIVIVTALILMIKKRKELAKPNSEN